VTRTRSISHTTPDLECFKNLYKCHIQWDKALHTQFGAPISLFQQWLACVENHTLLLIKNVSRFSTNERSMRQTLTDALLGTAESSSTVTRVQSKSHTTYNTGCVKILYKYEIQWVKPLQTHCWSSPSLSRQWLMRVVHHTLLLIRGVSRFSTNVRFSESNPHRRPFEHHWVFLDSYSCA